MPTYQYACTECGHAFDQVQSFTDDSLTECPVCAGRLRKVYNAVGVVFKGSGFYRNDSRKPEGSSSSSSPSASSETKSEGTSEGKSESGSETKSDTKSETKSEKKAESKPAPAAKP
ncbi:FmdB family zinc ribbon protein [Nocardioides sp.]|uniref:FmdB family zinc ribbon protein n=1 Tax=Nocardioides sp. TaxID=35761 RepID=UPI002718EDC0|nr:FmdB family zinc ribbon protein [Nocardioides sp.]MDO9455341.1 zinc ribbon domain-containing protein [Nocardioides sp.]